MTSKKRLLSIILVLVMMLSLLSSAAIPRAAAQGIEDEEVGPELPDAPEPTEEPTVEPTVEPSVEPTAEPTVEPTAEPTPEPSVEPTPATTVFPAFNPAPVNTQGVKIGVSAPEGVFPAGSKLSVSSVPVYDQEKVDAAVEDARDEAQVVAVSYTFDIKVLDAQGNEIQPVDGSKVSVSFSLAAVADENLAANVYHVSEDDSGDLTAQPLETTENGDTVTAETDGFSYYQVEFTYENKQYVLEGDGSVLLSAILEFIGLTGEVTDVEVSDESLFSASNEAGEWIITAHQAFSSEEWMKVTISDVIYEIVVTDAAGDPVTGDPFYTISSSSYATSVSGLSSTEQTIIGKSYKLKSYSIPNDWYGQAKAGIYGALTSHAGLTNGYPYTLTYGVGEPIDYHGYSHINFNTLRSSAGNTIPDFYEVNGEVAYCFDLTRPSDHAYPVTGWGNDWHEYNSLEAAGIYQDNIWNTSYTGMVSNSDIIKVAAAAKKLTENNFALLKNHPEIWLRGFNNTSLISNVSTINWGSISPLANATDLTIYGNTNSVPGTLTVKKFYETAKTSNLFLRTMVQYAVWNEMNGHRFSTPGDGGSWTVGTGSFTIPAGVSQTVETKGGSVTITGPYSGTKSGGIRIGAYVDFEKMIDWAYDIYLEDEANAAFNWKNEYSFYPGETKTFTGEEARYIAAVLDNEIANGRNYVGSSTSGITYAKTTNTSGAVTKVTLTASSTAPTHGWYGWQQMIDSSNISVISSSKYLEKKTDGSGKDYEKLKDRGGQFIVRVGETNKLGLRVKVEQPANGSITIVKKSSNTSVSNGNSAYKYNAVYGIYSDSACTTLVKQVTLTEGTNQGSATVTGLTLGTYYVKEIEAPEGFLINATASAGITLTVTTTSKTVNMTDEPKTGSITIVKKSSDTSITNGNSAYKYNAKYGVYSNAACTTKVAEITLTNGTNEGRGTVNGLPYGDYWVKEITAPDGFNLSTAVSSKVTISKASEGTEVTFGTANVERGTMVDSTGAVSTTSTTKRLRTKNFITLQPGTYVINNVNNWWFAYYLYSTDSTPVYKQSESHTSWIKGSEAIITLTEARKIKIVWRNASETDISPADITGEKILNNVITVNMTDTPITKPFTLQKRSANTDMTDGNSCYSLEGAQYGVYKTRADALADSNRVETLITDINGNATSTKSYALGTWYVKELVASPGYRLDGAVHAVTVTAVDANNVFTVTEEPGADPGRMEIQKITSSGATVRRITSGTTVFKVEYFANNNWNGTPDRTWYYQTIDGRTQIGEESYLDITKPNDQRYKDNDSVIFPLGTVKITEEQAPAGYIRTDLVWLAEVTQDAPGADGTWHWVTPEGGLVSYTADGPTLENEHRNGTLEVLKLDHLGNALPGVTFRLEYSTDGGTTWARTYKIDSDALTDYGACKSADLVDGELITGTDGKVVFEGLMADGEILYRLTEVKAPAGFTLLKDPVYEGTLPVPVDRDDLPDSEVIDGQAYSYTLTCRVTDTSQFVLPVSGGSGFGFLPLVMAATALGMALILTDDRKKRQE